MKSKHTEASIRKIFNGAIRLISGLFLIYVAASLFRNNLVITKELLIGFVVVIGGLFALKQYALYLKREDQ